MLEVNFLYLGAWSELCRTSGGNGTTLERRHEDGSEG